MEYTTIQKTADRWGVSHQYVQQLCQEGRIPGAVYENKHWRIPLYVAKPADRTSTRMPGYISATQAAEKWGTTRDFVNRAAKKGRIPGAKQVDRHWQIPEDAPPPTDGRSAHVPGYISPSKMAEKWGVSVQLVLRLCKESRISGAILIDDKWQIPADAVKPANKVTDRKLGYMSATEAAEKWGLSSQFVTRLCKEGHIPGAEMIDGYWHIPADATKPRQKRTNSIPGYLSAAKAAAKWGVPHYYVFVAAKEGHIPGAEFIDGKWYIPEDAICPPKGEAPVVEKPEQKVRYVSSAAMAKKWGTSNMFVCKAAREGLIPGAKKSASGGWRIPEDANYPGDENYRRREYGVYNSQKDS